jgi:hypothetical protein
MRKHSSHDDHNMARTELQKMTEGLSTQTKIDEEDSDFEDLLMNPI